jgi:hypothetical protein
LQHLFLIPLNLFLLFLYYSFSWLATLIDFLRDLYSMTHENFNKTCQFFCLASWIESQYDFGLPWIALILQLSHLLYKWDVEYQHFCVNLVKFILHMKSSLILYMLALQFSTILNRK